MKILKITLLFVIGLTLAFCNQTTSQEKVSKTVTNSIQVLSADLFKENSIGNQLIDIRTPQEYHQGYIENAVNIDFLNDTFLDKMEQLDKSKPIYIYCRSGNRTSYASKKLESIGFKEIYDLDGGINSWSKRGYKITK